MSSWHTPRTNCPRGHTMSDAYIRSNGHRECRSCRREGQRLRRLHREPLPPLPRGTHDGPRLPFDPIESRLSALGMNLSEHFNGTSLRRWRTEGIPVLSADAVCIRFGWHPVQVYGLDFYRDTA